MRRGLALLMAGAVVGCVTEPAASPIEVTVSASASSIVYGQPDTIAASVRNPSSDPVTLHFGSGCQVLPFVRRAGGDVLVPDGGWSCPAELTTLTLAPRTSRRWTFVWTGGTQFHPTSALAALPPGDYESFVRIQAAEVELISSGAPIQLRAAP